MQLYTDNKILEANKIILSEDINQKIITSQKLILAEDIENEYNRRKFMFFSLACVGMMLVPTRAEAYWHLVRLAYSIFKFVKNVVRSINVVNKVQRITTGINKTKKVHIPRISIPKKKLTKKNKLKQSYEIAEKLSDVIDLDISPKGVNQVTTHTSNNTTVWDRRGYGTSKNITYKNRAMIKITNKTSHSVERKIRFMLINNINKEELYHDFVLKADANDIGFFNLSDFFQELPKTGKKRLVYDILGNFNDVEVSSTDKNIFISKLLV